MNIFDLSTPSFLVDRDLLRENILNMNRICAAGNIELWPMVKAHKSTKIARMQHEAGAAGFLAGTYLEARRLIEAGYKKIMMAYPVAGAENITRLVGLCAKAELIVSLDGVGAAFALQEALQEADLCLDYLLIIDCGLHRFGVKPTDALGLANRLKAFKNLSLRGIATHPGQVYACTDLEGVRQVAAQEEVALQTAKSNLVKGGYQIDLVATGSTPTAAIIAQSKGATVLRPGNYVFYDNIQKNMGVVDEKRCALTVLATIISQPDPDTLIIDAGSKCFGLDKGAHGMASLEGYGYIKGYPELIIVDLSEEVGKVKIKKDCQIKNKRLQVGDKIQIIPNHACTCVNMTDRLIGFSEGMVKEIIEIDARGGSGFPEIIQ